MKPEEEVLKCPYCPCQFSTHHDFNLHLEAYGYKAEEHLRRFNRNKYWR